MRSGLLENFRETGTALIVSAAITLFSMSAHAACSNPSGIEGEIIFNSAYSVPQYCDDTDWIAMAGGYKANGVYFDGTNDYLETSAAPSGITDSKTFSGSFWFREFNPPSNIYANTNYRFSLKMQDWGGGPVLTFKTANSSDVTLMQAEVDISNDSDWHHVLFSFDHENPANDRVYIDDTLAPLTQFGPDPPTDDFIDFTTSKWFFLWNGTGDIYEGGIADFWLNPGTYINFSVEANRRKFIDADGKPVYLGADGSLPTGSAPDFFLTGDAANWHINKGTGGTINEIGEITDSSSDPVGGGEACNSSETGKILYNDDEGVPQFCDGSNWISMVEQASGVGWSGSNPCSTEGTMIYNQDYNVVQFCDGSDWKAIGKFE